MFKFSKREIIDLIISFLVLSLAFSILFTRPNYLNALIILPISMIGVGSSFIFHEIAHKLIAMHYGYWAEFKLWIEGLIIAIGSSFLGFIFAAPGAVYIHGEYIDDRENGIISSAGPLTNIVLAVIFFLVIPVVSGNQFLHIASILGFKINSFIAIFNLIPLGPLDGRKIFRWDPLIWLVLIAAAGGLTFYSMFGISF